MENIPISEKNSFGNFAYKSKCIVSVEWDFCLQNFRFHETVRIIRFSFLHKLVYLWCDISRRCAFSLKIYQITEKNSFQQWQIDMISTYDKIINQLTTSWFLMAILIWSLPWNEFGSAIFKIVTQQLSSNALKFSEFASIFYS